MASGFESPQPDERSSLLWPAVIAGAALVGVLALLVAGALAWRLSAKSAQTEAVAREQLAAANAQAITLADAETDQPPKSPAAELTQPEDATAEPKATPSGESTEVAANPSAPAGAEVAVAKPSEGRPSTSETKPNNVHAGTATSPTTPQGNPGQANSGGTNSGADSGGGGNGPSGNGTAGNSSGQTNDDDETNNDDEDDQLADANGGGSGGGGDTSVPTSLTDLLNAHPELIGAGGGAGGSVEMRQTVPTAANLSAKQAEIRSLFSLQEARTSEAKVALAKQMFAAARDTEDDPAAEFVLLTMTGDIAAAAGDLELALDAVDEMDQRFLIDHTLNRWDMYEKVAQSRDLTNFGRRVMLRDGPSLVEDLFRHDKYAEAAKLVKMLQGAARRVQDRQAQNELAILQRRGSELYAAYKKVLPALQTLETEPDDADASLAAGEFYAFVKADWPRGLALLAQSSSEPLQLLAIAERDRPEDPQARVDLGNGWWNLAATTQGRAAEMQRARAAMWYGLLVDDTTGLDQVRIRQRIEEADTLQADGGRPLSEDEAGLLGLD